MGSWQEDARELLEHLALPLGTATVCARFGPQGNSLVVSLAPSVRPAAQPSTWKGWPVVYRRMPKATPQSSPSDLAAAEYAHGYREGLRAAWPR